MAVAAWITYDEAHRYLLDGTVQLPTTVVNMVLVTSASNFNDTTLSTLSALTNELASARGYDLGGKPLTDTYSTGASAGEMRYDATSVIWTANGGNLGTTAVLKAALLVAQNGASASDGANKLLMWSQLSTNGFAVSDGNTLTITPNAANGIFELNRV